MKKNSKISQFSRFLLRSENAILFKIWKWLKLLNSVPFIKKTLVNHLYIWIWSFRLTFTALQWMKINLKIGQSSRFPLRSEHPIHVKSWKWLKLLNSLPFIKQTLVNKVYNRIWSFRLAFAVLQWMKKNSKISQFSSFLLRSGYAIQVKNLIMSKISFFVYIHQENTCKLFLHLNLIILTDFHRFTVNEVKLRN